MKSISPSVVPLLRMLIGTSADEISCDECDRRMSAFVECSARSRFLEPRMRVHLAHCPDCREEFEALLAIVRFHGALVH